METLVPPNMPWHANVTPGYPSVPLHRPKPLIMKPKLVVCLVNN
ncbi:hypothetical protein BMYO_1432 [Bifidobacterium myosotis]|uniref:Uncharacterized protein n=1 Tax=Bifidobacterium myosotis TaxID=1630166 RepID=A0A261FJ89_9BIFI|nr:hypothetical protein BMYO_1432 [Bifidobacterium myosotis]